METDALKLTSLQPGFLDPAATLVSPHEVSKAAPKPKPELEMPEKPVSREQIRRNAELVSEAVSRLNHGVRFEIDDSSDTIITKVIDRETNEIIRQYPPEEMLDIARRLREYVGVLLDIEA